MPNSVEQRQRAMRRHSPPQHAGGKPEANASTAVSWRLVYRPVTIEHFADATTSRHCE
jgi:hypothetical protein